MAIATQVLALGPLRWNLGTQKHPKTLGSAVVAYHYFLKPFYNQSHRYCTLQNTVTYSNYSVPCMCKSCILIGTIVAVLEMAEVRTPSHTYVPIQNVSILT